MKMEAKKHRFLVKQYFALTKVMSLVNLIKVAGYFHENLNMNKKLVYIF